MSKEEKVSYEILPMILTISPLQLTLFTQLLDNFHKLILVFNGQLVLLELIYSTYMEGIQHLYLSSKLKGGTKTPKKVCLRSSKDNLSLSYSVTVPTTNDFCGTRMNHRV
ncbi:hypothetical protein EDC96DRAFT_564721 [Choanephora cucurbitarum]|nr:hypothetical protein EDC96DRAFT_564721 [Choanephora cucurbitarum]